MDRKLALQGCLLGAAVGDAIGLPREGLSRARALRLFGPAPLEHALVFGRGMISDDTEHACMTAQSVLVSRGDVDRFARALAWRLRWWLLGVPAGIGWATLRSTLKLWVGVNPQKSGVASAGNGPAMRSAILGVLRGNDHAQLSELVRASTRVTHTDPRAEEGALLVAIAAHHGANLGAAELAPIAFIDSVRPLIRGEELLKNVDLMVTHLDRNASAEEFAESLGLSRGVTGYINHTVPVALYCWLRHPTDFRAAVESVVCLGGDTDTVGSIVDSLAGATLGPSAIPRSWLDRLVEWPRSVAWIESLGARLDEAAVSDDSAATPLSWPAILPRNAFFAAVVLTHGFRRLAPPY